MFFSLVCAMYIPFFFFFNDTATTEIYTLSLHDALPISRRSLDPPIAHRRHRSGQDSIWRGRKDRKARGECAIGLGRSEEHTSELQSQSNLVCRLLLEKKKNHFETHTASPTTQQRSAK